MVLPRSESVPLDAIEKLEMEVDAVLTANRYLPSGVMVTQQGAVWLSANGEPVIEFRAPLGATVYAETVPRRAPACAFETNSWFGFVGRNSLPNGPVDWAANGEPGAACSRP